MHDAGPRPDAGLDVGEAEAEGPLGDVDVSPRDAEDLGYVGAGLLPRYERQDPLVGQVVEDGDELLAGLWVRLLLADARELHPSVPRGVRLDAAEVEHKL